MLIGGKGTDDIRSGEERAQYTVDFTINPDFKAKPEKEDGMKDEIAEGSGYTFTKGENDKYTFILTDSDGNEHKTETDEIPATIEDKDGNTYEVDEKGNLALKESNTSPDYPGTYSPEYMILIGNTIDNEDGKSETKGFSRNCFVAEDEAEFKLQQWVEYGNGYVNKTDLACYWYIDSVSAGKDMTNGIILKKPWGAYRVEARDSSNNVLIHLTAAFIDSPEIVFATNKDYKGEYGFDDNRFDEIAVLNDYKELSGKNKYRIPFMSLPVNGNATIEARLAMNKKGLSDEDLKKINIQFSPSYGISIAKKGYMPNGLGGLNVKLNDFINNKLELDIYSDRKNENSFISSLIGMKEIGKVLIESKEMLKPSTLRLIKVVVNNSIGKDIDIQSKRQEVETLLNKKSYNQCFVQWSVISDILYITLDKDFDSLFSIFTEAKKQYVKTNADDYIMFMSKGEGACGFGHPDTLKSLRYSIVNTEMLVNSNDIVQCDITSHPHELGHNHGLLDINGEFKSIFLDTNNYMDYSVIRNMFWKWQWRKIYDLHNSDKNIIPK